MEITEEQRQLLENKRKMIRSAPVFEPSRTTWRDWEQAWNDFAVTSGIGFCRVFVDFSLFILQKLRFLK